MANTKRKPSKSSLKDSSKFTHLEVGGLKNLLAHKRLVLAFGGLLLLFAAVTLGAFVSYLFNHENDEDLLAAGNSFLLSSDIKPKNWFGRLGAWISHILIFRGFGLGAFAAPYILFWMGAKIVFKDIRVNLAQKITTAVFLMVLISLTLGFITSWNSTSNQDFWGGFYGHFWINWVKGFIGDIGAALFVLFAWLGFITIYLGKSMNFNLLSFKGANSLFGNRNQDEEDNELETSPGNRPRNKNNTEENEIEPTVIDFEHTTGRNKAKPQAEKEFEIVRPVTAYDTEPEKELPIADKPETHALEIAETTTDDEKIYDTNFKDSNTQPYDPTLDLSNYIYPSTDLLAEHSSGKLRIDADELERNKNQIVETLGHYNIEIDKIRATVGPTVTLYEIIPMPGVRIAKIKNLEDDIALSLAALGIRIIAPMPGKGTIGIEVPNKNKEIVSMKSLMASPTFINFKGELPVVLGKTISNEIYVADLAKMPHLLMAGATGQGKSVGLNVILTSLLYRKHPSQLKLVMVDPKKVELSLYQKIEKHFLAKLPDEDEPIITDTTKVIHTLNSLCIEMDNRYELLKNAQAKNIKEYNQKFIDRKLNPERGHHFMPYIVLVIDEFADLMLTAGKSVESPITRLAQLARAVGIHLIIATQRPSVNIITGTIKANFPARLAYRVTSKVDSRTILDESGADRLIGQGDMLLSLNSTLIRLQCPFIDTPEVERVAEFIGNQQGYPEAFPLPEYVPEGEESSKEFDASNKDVLFDEACRMIVRHQQGSTSLLQRKLKLGYNRAGRIMDQLEASGVVGPFEGSKAREVLIKDEYALEQFLNNIQ